MKRLLKTSQGGVFPSAYSVVNKQLKGWLGCLGFSVCITTHASFVGVINAFVFYLKYNYFYGRDYFFYRY